MVNKIVFSSKCGPGVTGVHHISFKIMKITEPRTILMKSKPQTSAYEVNLT